MTERKKTKEQTTIYKTLRRKLKIEQNVRLKNQIKKMCLKRNITNGFGCK